MDIQIIPFSGRTLDFGDEGTGKVRFSSSGQGFLLGRENAILEPMIQEIINGRIPLERQPILFYGKQGIGRTHLLRGILEAWRKNQSHETIRRQAYYSTCADFARQFTESVAARTTDAFRRRYHKAKLILLDDLEQLLGKPIAQMELRLLLDAMKENSMIVLTAQMLPKARVIGKKTNKGDSFSPDLVSRIQSGTAIPIALPGEAVRQRFLHDLASAWRIPATETLLCAAAKTLTGTIPQLYAAVAQKYMEAKAAEEPLDLTFWQHFTRKPKKEISLNLTEIAKRTATYFSLKLTDLKGQSRSRTIVQARSLAIYLAKTKLQLTFKEIGLFFGKRDPSTVRHLFEKVECTLPNNPELRDHLFRIERL